MKRIYDTKEIARVLQKYHISEYFETPDLTFVLIEYMPGELLSHQWNGEEYLQIILEGSVSVYAIRRDGTPHLLTQPVGFFVLGDLEFCGLRLQDSFAEAIGHVITIAISLQRYRETLKKDRLFLNFLVRGLAEKLVMVSASEIASVSIEEKLLNYMRMFCLDKQLSGIERVALQLHCSARQLQRVLKRLAEKGRVERYGKGKWRLKE